MKEKSRRSVRVGEEIRRILSEIIRRDLSEPVISLASISEVDVSADFSHAKVYVGSLGDESQRDAATKRLNELQGRIRHLLSRQLRLRRTPSLVFVSDVTAAHADHISRLLQEVLPNERNDDEEE